MFCDFCDLQPFRLKLFIAVFSLIIRRSPLGKLTGLFHRGILAHIPSPNSMRAALVSCPLVFLTAFPLNSTAQTTGYSVNVVGVVSVAPRANQYIAICNPLTNTSVPNTLGNLVGTNLPVNAQVLKWNYSRSRFDIYKRISFGNGWLPTTAPDATLNPGEGFFVQSPAAITNTFVGDVLDPGFYGILTNSLRSGFELLGSKQPLRDSMPNIGLNLPSGTFPQNQILKWNAVRQKYDIYKRLGGLPIGWTPSIPTNNVGDGFFTFLSAPFAWIQNFTVQ